MEYRVTYCGEPKPLADFYDGECFESSADDYDSLMMCVGGETNAKANERAVYNFYTGEICYWGDENVFRPVWVDIERLGE